MIKPTARMYPRTEDLVWDFPAGEVASEWIQRFAPIETPRFLAINSEGITIFDGKEKYTVNVCLGPDAHFVKLLDGYWVRQVTIAEVFVRWPGPYDIIDIRNTGRNRDLWHSDQIQAALPHVYVINEDGHNEDVVRNARERGYRCYIIGDVLIMRHA